MQDSNNESVSSNAFADHMLVEFERYLDRIKPDYYLEEILYTLIKCAMFMLVTQYAQRDLHKTHMTVELEIKKTSG